MSIKPKCDKCQNELAQPGGLAFSLSSDIKKTSEVMKYYLCVWCWQEFIEWLPTRAKLTGLIDDRVPMHGKGAIVELTTDHRCDNGRLALACIRGAVISAERIGQYKVAYKLMIHPESDYGVCNVTDEHISLIAGPPA